MINKFYLSIFQELDTTTTVLTPNRRLSATLHKHYQQYQIEQQQKCWPTPDILPITSWIERLWHEHHAKQFSAVPLVLNVAQEQFLWEQILLNEKSKIELLQLSETADIAKSAWSLLKQWQVDLKHPIFNTAEDYLALQEWAQQFQKKCCVNKWIDYATLPDQLIEHIQNKNIIPPRTLLLVGFAELSPQLKQLIVSCENAGSKIVFSRLMQDQVQTKRISLLDQEQEILTLARWAKSTWEKNKTTSISCAASIGCVIPSLDKIRDRVLQIFSEVFAENNTYAIDTQRSPFNLSAGKNLLHFPIINTALQLLALYKKNVSAEALSYLLASPFLGEAEVERIKRAQFDSLLRQENIHSITLSALTESNENKSTLTTRCPLLAKRLKRFLTLIDENQSLRNHSEWATLFNQLLTALGWPGERSLSSEEYQVVDAWLKLLTEYITLDQISTPVNFHQALQTLQKLVSKHVFQPKTPDAPIQVLGVLEAAAHPFDYLWIAGMDDLSWPPQPHPNPFIPKRLQRELNMPHATAERELVYCEQLIEQFKRSASTVIFSHAQKNEDLELQASPLIRDLSEIHVDDLQLVPYLTPSERIYQSKKMENLLDESGPLFQENETIRGGTDIIKQQALCPFKAFAIHRLRARELEAILPGLRPKERGNIIHKSLEIIWNRLQNHATLTSMDDEALANLIHESVEIALNAVQTSHHTYVQYLSLEKTRLHRVVNDWLSIEKNRAAFNVVNREKEAKITIGKLTFSIRIDRIDELSDGKKLIIDYKTGKNNEINSWLSERPEEPQLPLYSLLDPDNTIGITFAQIATGENCFKGMSRYALDIKGIKIVSEIKKTQALSWEEQLTQWQLILTKLSEDFYHGVAKVDPKDPNQTCTWCALKSFCRISEEINIANESTVN